MLDDLRELNRSAGGDGSLRSLSRTALLNDSFGVLLTFRLRKLLPVLNRGLRIYQTMRYGLELGRDVELGHGVYFVHSIGNVIGGDARIGARVKLMGNNTIGTAKDNGYPVIEDDVTLGAGARVLGPVRIGRGAVIGANAVVLTDIPAGAIAVGAPARVLGER